MQTISLTGSETILMRSTTLRGRSVDSVQESYMQSIRSVILVTCAFSVPSAFMSVFIRQHVLHSKFARR